MMARFGINATKPWSAQLDLFRDVAPVAEPSVSPSTLADAASPVRHRPLESEWRFASKFCTKSGWRKLLADRHLTRLEYVGDAVLNAMHRYQQEDQIDWKIARTILTELGSIDPGVGQFSDEDMIVAVCEQVFFNAQDREELAWQRIHAWELGLVRYRKGLAEPTDPRRAAA